MHSALQPHARTHAFYFRGSSSALLFGFLPFIFVHCGDLQENEIYRQLEVADIEEELQNTIKRADDEYSENVQKLETSMKAELEAYRVCFQILHPAAVVQLLFRTLTTLPLHPRPACRAERAD